MSFVVAGANQSTHEIEQVGSMGILETKGMSNRSKQTIFSVVA